VVDEILGQQQVVIKSLGHRIGRIKGVSGAAILGDGRVALILDVGGLFTQVNDYKQTVAQTTPQETEDIAA
jgi:two-component system chemotaxis sensor kinase CheA